MSSVAGAATTLVPSPKSLAELRVFTMPQGGLDRLNFVTWDTIEVPGRGEETIEFRGHYMIDRADPTSADWREGSVDITMRELSVSGVSTMLGRIRVGVNDASARRSGGQVRAGTTFDGWADSPKLCSMDGYMQFELLDVGVTAVNREPIVLRHTITHIPPVGQGGGTGRIAVNLYSTQDPDGPPVAILREVRTHIGAWLAQPDAPAAASRHESADATAR